MNLILCVTTSPIFGQSSLIQKPSHLLFHKRKYSLFDRLKCGCKPAKVGWMRRTESADQIYLSNLTEGKPMASKYWIKLYHEILDDPKMGRLPDALFRRAIEFFLIAGERGREGDLPPLADIAWRLRADEIEPAGADGGPGGAQHPQPRCGWRLARGAFQGAPGSCADDRARAQAQGAGDVQRDLRPAIPATQVQRIAAQIQMEAACRCRLRTSPSRSALQARERRGLESDYRAPRQRTQQDGSEGKPQMQRYTDTDRDIDSESEPDEEAEADGDAPSARNSGFRDEELVKLFIEKTGLPLYFGGEDKWARALERMQQAGVEAADLEQAIDECRTKGLTIASLASLVNPAIIARSRRLAGRPEEDYRRYLKGEYGEFGR